MKILIASVMFLFLLVSVEPAFSHSEGTNSSGSHTNHRTGDYHCHDREDDNNGCAIAGPEDINGSIILNLFLIGLNVFLRPMPDSIRRKLYIVPLRLNQLIKGNEYPQKTG